MRIDHRRLISAAKRAARLTGGAYLLIMFGVTVTRVAVHLGLRIPGMKAPTEPTGVRVGLIDDIALAAVFASIGGAVYLLLRHFDRHTTGRRAAYIAVTGGIMTVNLLLQRAAIATGSLSSSGGVRNSGGLMSLLLNMHDHGYAIAALILWLLLVALGHLAYQSARYPAVVSVVITVGWIAATAVKFVWPELPTDLHAALAPPAVVDVWLIAYLVAKGRIRPLGEQRAARLDHRVKKIYASAMRRTDATLSPDTSADDVMAADARGCPSSTRHGNARGVCIQPQSVGLRAHTSQRIAPVIEAPPGDGRCRERAGRDCVVRDSAVPAVQDVDSGPRPSCSRNSIWS